MGEPNTTSPACIWTENDVWEWSTSCGNEFDETNSSPDEHGTRFCCYCGKPLEQERHIEAEEQTEEPEPTRIQRLIAAITSHAAYQAYRLTGGLAMLACGAFLAYRGYSWSALATGAVGGAYVQEFAGKLEL